MGKVLTLAWWLLLLASMQVSARILDGFRFLGWGAFGYSVLKALYLAFAAVLLIRYRSFRRQRTYESLAESYQRVAGKEYDSAAARRDSRLNPFLHWLLVVLAALDVALAWVPGLLPFRITIALDAAIWLLIIRWVARACWLGSRGARERLKAAVDDARSRSRPVDAEPVATPKRVSPVPFALLGVTALALSLGIALVRWTGSGQVFRIGELETCMDAGMRDAAAGFYQEGQARVGLADEACVRRLAGQVDFSLDWSGGELRLRAGESPASDFFGNGKTGDEGLALDGNAFFRKTRAGEGLTKP